MDDLATIDLPAQIDYALKTTRASKLAYVGHSQVCSCCQLREGQYAAPYIHACSQLSGQPI
jgi:predicted alpha/beta hydrolase